MRISNLRLGDVANRLWQVEDTALTLRQDVAGLGDDLAGQLCGKVDFCTWEKTVRKHEEWMEDTSRWLQELRIREEGLREVVGQISRNLEPPLVGTPARGNGDVGRHPETPLKNPCPSTRAGR